MNKAELIDLVAQKTEQPKTVVNGVLDAAFEAIMDVVAKGESAAFVGFGTFGSSERAARTGRNPQTGAELAIEATVVPKFTAGSVFKAKVKNGAAST